MKCTKIYNARAQPLFCLLNLLFSDVPVAVAVVSCVRSLFCGIRTWMGDQKRIPRVVITSFFFHFLSKTIIKTADLPSLV